MLVNWISKCLWSSTPLFPRIRGLYGTLLDGLESSRLRPRVLGLLPMNGISSCLIMSSWVWKILFEIAWGKNRKYWRQVLSRFLAFYEATVYLNIHYYLRAYNTYSPIIVRSYTCKAPLPSVATLTSTSFSALHPSFQSCSSALLLPGRVWNLE